MSLHEERAVRAGNMPALLTSHLLSASTTSLIHLSVSLHGNRLVGTPTPRYPWWEEREVCRGAGSSNSSVEDERGINATDPTQGWSSTTAIITTPAQRGSHGRSEGSTCCCPSHSLQFRTCWLREQARMAAEKAMAMRQTDLPSLSEQTSTARHGGTFC